MTEFAASRWAVKALALIALAGPWMSATQARSDLRSGDYIAAVVNQEVVTAGEVERRVQQALAQANAAPNAKLPPLAEVRKQALDALIDERVMISNARESGMKVDDSEVDRAVQSIAAANKISLDVLRQRLRAEGTDYSLFRGTIRDQMMIERLREREVYQRIKISEEDIDAYLDQQRKAALADAPTNIAQILIAVPEGADEKTVAARRALAEAALARVRSGESFAKVAQQLSSDSNAQNGGEIGLRPASRLPDVFVDATKALQNGQIAPELLRTGAGFHILKLIERKTAVAGQVTETHVRHVLLRSSAELSAEVATRRIEEYRQEIESGKSTFEEIARKYSEDGSAAAGGDLGWAAPGVMVPEFEAAMNALTVGGISQPVLSRFGVHLIQVLGRREVSLEPRQVREQARNVLREQKFDQAYLDWTKELRARAYVEYREPPSD
jgi:peptidyl-prolyl cis-trans isomerase SurA